MGNFAFASPAVYTTLSSLHPPSVQMLSFYPTIETTINGIEHLRVNSK